MLDGVSELFGTKKQSFQDTQASWSYGNGKVKQYSTTGIGTKTNNAKEYQYRSAASFLKNLTNGQKKLDVDLSQYETGKRVYHKKFGEGTINYVERENDDLKVDITFDKAGHKRLMAKFAGLEIID